MTPDYATQWHRRPDRSNLPCPFCGVRHPKPGQHRRVPGSDPPTWERRRKSDTGWRSEAITPVPLPKPRDQRKKRPNELTRQNFPHVVGSLARYFVDEMAPRNQGEWVYHTAVRYRAAIAKIRECKKRDVAAAEVDEAMIGEFGQWLAKRGTSPDTAWDLQRRLRTVLADWRITNGLQDPKPDPEPEEEVDPDSLVNVLELYKLKHRMNKQSANLMRYTIKHFGDFLKHAPTTRDLTEDTVSAWLAEMETRYSQSSVSGWRIRILGLWRTAAKRRLVYPADTDEIRKCSPPEPFPVAWQLDEVRQLLDACDRVTGTAGGVPKRDRFRAIILAAYDTGLRKSDLFRIRREQIRPDGTVYLQQHKTRRKHFPRMRPETVAAVLALPGDCPLRWPSRNFYREWPKLRRAAGLDAGGLHQLRRTGATHVAKEHGMDAARRFLGHRSPEMVFHYVDESIALQETYLPPPILSLELGADSVGEGTP